MAEHNKTQWLLVSRILLGVKTFYLISRFVSIITGNDPLTCLILLVLVLSYSVGLVTLVLFYLPGLHRWLCTWGIVGLPCTSSVSHCLHSAMYLVSCIFCTSCLYWRICTSSFVLPCDFSVLSYNVPLAPLTSSTRPVSFSFPFLHCSTRTIWHCSSCPVWVSTTSLPVWQSVVSLSVFNCLQLTHNSFLLYRLQRHCCAWLLCMKTGCGEGRNARF